MADQSNRPYRDRDPYGHAQQGAQASGGGDPLAELARLIGQNDPFSNLAQAPAPRRAEAPAEWRPDPYQNYGDPHVAAPNGGAHPDSYPPAAAGNYPPAAAPYPPRPEPQYDSQPYAEQQGYRGTNDQYQPAYGARPPGYGGGSYAPPGQGYESDPFYRDAPHGADMYDDPAPARRRGSMLTVTAVLALALIGTAAAFGYRAVFGTSGNTPPPVIKAETTPNKIVPTSTANEQSKQIYDRVGDRNQAERIVAREEKPVDVKDAVRAAPPRVVSSSFAADAMSNPAPAASPPIPANASALAPAAIPPATTEPKRVRTVTIRADQPGGAEPLAARPAPQPVRSAAPMQVASVAPVAEPVAPSPVRPAAPRAAPPPVNSNAPLSLAPPSAAPAASTRHAPMRTASVPPAAAGGGAYTVQISSQRSEAEAQSAFRSLQAKFPNLLSGRQPIIRRADLGDRGVYYRAQVGPFASSDQAGEFCASLKAAGGQCVVQRN